MDKMKKQQDREWEIGGALQFIDDVYTESLNFCKNGPFHSAGDTRLLCLKLFSDMSSILLTGEQFLQRTDQSKLLHKIIEESLLPQ